MADGTLGADFDPNDDEQLPDLTSNNKSEFDSQGSTDTEPYSLNLTPQNSIQGRRSIHDTSLKRKHSGNDTTGAGTSANPFIRRLISVAKDAENIASVLGISNVDLVYERVKQLRNRGNRSDIVTNEILENGVEGLQSKVKTSMQNSVSDSQNTDEEEVEAILSEIEDVRAAVLEVYPKAQIIPDEIYAALEKHHKKVNRVEFVRDLILRKLSKAESIPDNQTQTPDYFDEDDELVADVEHLMKKFPELEAHDAYKILAKHKNSTNKLEKVTAILKEQYPEDHDKGTRIQKSIEKDLAKDPLYWDTMKISAMFPHRDHNEIYAYLEAHHSKSNRVQIVSDELLKMDQGSQENDDEEPSNCKKMKYGDKTEKTSQYFKNNVDSDLRTCSLKKPKKEYKVTFSKKCLKDKSSSPEARCEQEVELLLGVFPDCDPNYLFEQLENQDSDPDRVQKLSNIMFEHEDYPKLKDRLEKEERLVRRQRLQNMTLDIEEFLRMFAKPEQVFLKMNRTSSPNYRNHALVQLKNDFPLVFDGYIEERLNAHFGRYTPTYQELQELMLSKENGQLGRTRVGIFATSQRDTQELPDDPDDFFYWELMYAKHNQVIKDHILKQEEDLQKRKQDAILNSTSLEIFECGICYCRDFLPEEIITCKNKHQYCRECTKKNILSLFGMLKTSFPCPSTDCGLCYDIGTVKDLIPAKSFSVLLRRIQEEEIRQADIEDLVSCPFCSFATIMTDSNDRIFKCLNPDCLRESCRLCQQPNHIPLRCDEVKKPAESDLRTYMESKMTEAMIRTCWKCKRRYFKVEGCNRMKCSCGALMCYVCRRPLSGSDYHECEEIDAVELHREEMEQAGIEAKRKYLEDHPEAKIDELDCNPLDIVKKKVVRRKVIKNRRNKPTSPHLFGFVPIPKFLRWNKKSSPQLTQSEEYIEVEVNPLIDDEYHELSEDDNAYVDEDSEILTDEEEFNKALREYEAVKNNK